MSDRVIKKFRVESAFKETEGDGGFNDGKV